MADPLNPHRTPEELLQHLRERYPNASASTLAALAALIGYDLPVPAQSEPPATKPPPQKLKIPSHWIKSDRSGETLTIIGAKPPGAKRSP